MATRGMVLFKLGDNDPYRVYYNHYDSYPTGLGLSLIRLLKERKTEDEIVEKLELEDYSKLGWSVVKRPEDAFLKVQGDIEWIYAIRIDHDRPDLSSIQIYRTSNPWTEVKFVYTVWFCYAKFLPENAEDEMRIIQLTAFMVLRAIAAYEEETQENE